MHLLFKFPTDANFYDLAAAARKMRIAVAELENRSGAGRRPVTRKGRTIRKRVVARKKQPA